VSKVHFCVTVTRMASCGYSVYKSCTLTTFTGEALVMKRKVVDKGKTVNITDRTKLTGASSYVQPFSTTRLVTKQTQTDRQTQCHSIYSK